MMAYPAVDHTSTAAMRITPLHPGYDAAANSNDLRRYFESPSNGLEIVEDGLQEITFGEYLVQRGVVDRFELFRALQMQDRFSGVRIGECIVALGYATGGKIEDMYAEFAGVETVTID